MKKLSLLLLFFSFILTGCFKSIEDDPEILYRAIKKNPKKFLEVLNEAAQEARKQAEEDEVNKQKQAMEEEFKNPKKTETKGRLTFGDPNAPVEIVEYSDFQCGYCSKGYRTVKEILEKYKGKVKVVYKHLVLFGEKSKMASRYYEIIGLQGVDKARKFHDELFINQQDFKNMGEEALKIFAKKSGANISKLEADLKDEAVLKKVDAIIDADTAEGRKNDFSGTPGFLVNGVSLKGAYPFESFKEIIDRHLAKK